MVGCDILLYFERFYYTRLPAGTLRRWFAICKHFWIHWMHWVSVRVKLIYRRIQAAIWGRFFPRVNQPVGM